MFDNLSDKEKLIYLAGVFEGEGSFGIWNNKIDRKNKTVKKYINIAVQMTDEDTIRKFSNFFGGPYQTYKPRAHQNKIVYCWRTKGKKSLDILHRIMPYLGKRRQEKFNNLLLEYNSRENKNKEYICLKVA